MTGMELLEGLSHIDPRYVAEAETTPLGSKVPWVKLLSLAACLCILLTGTLVLAGTNHKTAEMEAAAPAAPLEDAAPMEEIVEEAAPEPPAAVEAEMAADELQEIPYAKLRVTRLGDTGFEAIVEETDGESTLLVAGDQILLVVDPSRVPGQIAEITNDLSWVTEGMVVLVEEGAYDVGIGTLYAAELLMEVAE